MYVKDTGEYVFKISGTDKYAESNVYVSSVDLEGAPTKPIDFDGYNKLTLIDAGSNVSANVTYFSNTYELGSANVLYINGAGTYDLEMSGSNVFALSSNVVGAISTGVIANPVFTSTTAITTDTNWTSGSGWEITADSTNNSTDRPGWKAFDNTWETSNEQNIWHSAETATSTSSPKWLKIKYPSAYKAIQYSIQIRDLSYPRYPKTWKFQGSNNDSDWTDLDTQTNKTDWAGNNTVMFTFSNSTAYQYYRVYITATDTSDSDGGCCIRELKVYTLATGSQVGNVPLPDYTYPNTITVDSALSGTSIIIANDSHQVSGGKWYTLNHSTYIGNRFIFWDNAIGYWSYFDTQGNRPDSSWDNPGGPPGRFFMETDGDLKLFHGSNGSTIMHIKPNSSSNPWPRISAPSLTFDGYNKLTLENFTTTESDTRTAKLTDPNGSTYALGQTQDAIYIKDQGDYFLEVTNSDQSAVVKKTVGTVTSPPTYQYIGFGGMTDLSGSYTTTNTYLLKLTKADGTPLLYTDIETFTILMDNGNGTNLDFTHIFEETKEPYAAAVGATTTTWHGDSQLEVTALADGTTLSDHATNTYIAFYFKLNEPTTIIDGAILTVHRNDKEQWKNTKAFGTNTDPSTFSSPHTPTDWTELVEVTTVDGPLGSYNGGSNPSEPWTSLGATQDFNASAPGRHLSLNFDTYNKLTFTGADTGSTYKLKYESNTYDLGTISNVYIAYPGTYSAEIKGATNFALTKNVVGALDSDSDSVSFTIFPSSISLGGHWQNNYGPATYTKTSHTITQIVYDLTGSAILSALGGSTTAHGIKFNATSSGIELDVENADDDNTPHTFTSTTITTATSSGIVTVGQSISLKAANGNEEATFTVPYFGYIIGSPTFLNFDGYNKLSIQNITPTSTTLKYFSNTYEIGTVTNIYVENTGDYSAEIGNATDFALTSNVVSSVAQIEPGFASRYQGSMALTYDGKLYAWGMNDDGEAGVGTSSDITVPTLCTGITQGTVAKLLSSSDLTDNSRGEVSYVKTIDGKIYATGKGDNFVIPGTTSDLTSFTDVTSYFGDQSLTANNVTMMSFTQLSGAALTETGNVWTWGTHDSTNKALGQANASSSSTPKQINFSSATDNITKITCGAGHSLALDTSGDVWFWGKNTINSDSWPSSVTDEPQKVVDGKNIIGLASSYGTMFAWDATGKMWNAGNNWEGHIGDGTTTTNTTGKTLTEVTYFSSNGITINKVYAGGYSVFVDTSDGYYCWGNGSYGVFGNGSTGNITSGPAKWTNVTNIKKFMASTEHTTAITEDGKYYAWGRGTDYARGDNTTGDISYPKYIDTLPNILAPSFEFDGYDKVLVNYPEVYKYDFYINVLPDNNLVFHEINFKDSTGASIKPLSYDKYNEIPVASWATGDISGLFDGSTTAPPDFGFYKSDSSVGDKMFYVILPKLASSVVISHARPKYAPGFKIKVGTSVVFSEDSNGGTGETPEPYSKTCTLSTNVSKSQYTKYTKDTQTYDANQAQIVTVSDPGTYDAQIKDSENFSLKSATVPATKTSGLYTWAFHHGNFDNAYGDGDILTARDNGRFYADTPSYTGDIGTITPTSVSSFVYKVYCTVLPGPTTGHTTDANATNWILTEISSTTTSLTSAMFTWADSNYLGSGSISDLFDGDTSESGGYVVVKSYNQGGLAVNRHMFTITSPIELLQLSISTHRPGYYPGIKIILNDTHTLVNETINQGTSDTPSPFTKSYTFSSNYIASTHGTKYTFTPASTLTANVLMVAGGGGGGGNHGGGGGAGGLVYTTGVTLSGTKTIVIGNGSFGGVQTGATLNGNDTTFTGLDDAFGGGGGGGGQYSGAASSVGYAGGDGGSGGGGTSGSNPKTG